MPLLDVVFTLLGIFVILLVVNELEVKNKRSINSLIIDNPLNQIDEDEYERRELYLELISKIKEIDFRENKSFAIAITNDWGDGKTSFMNFLKSEVRSDENTLIIDFNPWMSLNSDNMTIDFFYTLNEELSKYIYIGSELKAYANNLTAINSVFNPLKYVPNNWIGEVSHSAQFKKINSLIKKVNKRIFILIDDIDRLDNKEVINILRTIRNTANFTGVHFIVPFDKFYILNAIEQSKIAMPNQFLKKIFDLELLLSPISKYTIQNIFYKNFEKLFNEKIIATKEQKDNYETQLKSIVYDDGLVIQERAKYTKINALLFKYITNKRDIIRFYNSFSFIFEKCYPWAYLPDLFLLELIKMLDYKSYKILYQTKDFIKSVSSEDGREYFSIVKTDENNDTDVVERLMSRRISEFKIEELITDDDVKILINELFNLPVLTDFKSKHALTYTDNFDNYFKFKEIGVGFDFLDNNIYGNR
jgi:hypothetical protein